MDEWEKFVETTLPDKKEFCSNLSKENITDTNHMYAKWAYKEFVTKKLGEYLDLYLKNHTLRFADIFKHFRKMCQNIYHLDPTNSFSTPGLACQAAL